MGGFKIKHKSYQDDLRRESCFIAFRMMVARTMKLWEKDCYLSPSSSPAPSQLRRKQKRGRPAGASKRARKSTYLGFLSGFLPVLNVQGSSNSLTGGPQQAYKTLLLRFVLRCSPPCQRLPSLCRALRSFRLSFLHRRHLVKRCSTDCSAWPHHQHWGVSITPILAK